MRSWMGGVDAIKGFFIIRIVYIYKARYCNSNSFINDINTYLLSDPEVYWSVYILHMCVC